MPYHDRMSSRSPFIALALMLGAGLTLVAGQTNQAPGPRPQASAQSPTAAPDARWRRAADAWDEGRYPDALTELLALMRSPAASEYLERVALLTGELFVTTEVSADARTPRISADGQLALYETGDLQKPVTRLVRVGANPQVVTELPAVNVLLDPTGTRLAWLRLPAPGADPSMTEIAVRDLASGDEVAISGGGLLRTGLAWSSDGRQLFFVGGGPADPARSDVYSLLVPVQPTDREVRLTDRPGHKTNLIVDPSGAALIYAETMQSPFAGRGGRGGPGGGGGGGRGGGVPAGTPFVVVDLKTKATRTITGTGLTISADGSTLAWITRGADGSYTLNTSPTLTDKATTVRSGRERINAPTLSPNGKLVAYEFMEFTDWEIYVSDGATHRRLTRDIPHDILPRFLTNTTLLGMTGEARHRRASVYDLETGTRTRLLHNNTIRTVVPEYAWLPSQTGRRVFIVADRDGDTISAERGLYLVDLDRRVTASDVIARLEAQLAAENDLRQRMTKAFQPLADQARKVLSKASVTRVWDHARALFDFDSKHISQPGNAFAIEYLTKAYASFGYKPEQQWFNQASARGGRTANVLATLRGTVDPDLIYVASSHFDSVAGGPGADDDTSGTTALLEAARILADTPLPATVVFASFTGEEAGLLGSREFVRQAGANKWQVVGALNNDMIGWAGESARMDNTIRFSNAGIRDIQHGASFLFTNLILYDARYYRSTDAAAFFDAWGDIVGGIGSYPILSNPNYHQPTDYLDTINQRQVTETAKVTAATLMYLASSPSRLKDLKVSRAAGGLEVTWTPSPESSIKTYVVAYGPATDPLRTRINVSSAKAGLPALPPGTQIAVKAVNARGLEGWDWARTVVQ